jgi:uncharacterized protein (TIGR02466 family)
MTFNGVWPTFLVKRQLPGFEQPTKELAAYIAEQEARAADNTARYLEQKSFFTIEHPAIRWLKGQIDQTATAFLQQAGVQRELSWSLVGWFNTNRYGDHHAAHTHPRAYLSGTYYVRVPPPGSVEGDHPQSGCISFYDPRTGANMVTAGLESDARASHVVRPGAGTLLMWPSPLQHYVHPNLSEEHRVSISFNLMMDPAAYRSGL